MELKIALAGNPNSGKTTLFNALTGSNQYVGNWPGVTVEKKEGSLKNHRGVTVTDLPGIYSLSPYTMEEVVARNYLLNERPDVILNIVDGTNLERNLYLTTQLMELHIPLVVAVNMIDVVRKRGDTIDIAALSDELGTPVVEISALKELGIEQAVNTVFSTAAGERHKARRRHHGGHKSEADSEGIFAPSVEAALSQIAALSNAPGRLSRWYAVKLFERDERVLAELSLSAEAQSSIESIISALEAEFADAADSIITTGRYGYIEKILFDCYIKNVKTGYAASARIDRVVTGKFTGLPVFAVVMFLVYWLAMGPLGTLATDWANDGVFGDGWHFLGIGSAECEQAESRYGDADAIIAAFAEAYGDETTLLALETDPEAALNTLLGKTPDDALVIYQLVDEETLKTTELSADKTKLISAVGEYLSTEYKAAVGAPQPAEYGAWVPGVPVLVERALASLGVADWLSSLINGGIIAGVGAVLGFVPQLLILFFMLGFLEACGYMSRIAYVLDRIFRKIGLSGKSFIPMLIGTGCGVPGIMASRTIESEADRRMTVLTTTFIPCGAKVPVIAMISGALFGGSALISTSAYLLGILAVVLTGLMLKKTKPFAGEPASFVMELPAYHLPTLKALLTSMWERGWSFIKKAGTIILCSTIVVWLLTNFGFIGGSLRLLAESELSHSILARIGGLISWLFIPLGWGNWEAAVATLTGILAKENIVGTMGVLYGAGGNVYAVLAESFTPISAYSFLSFNLLCAPCAAAIGAIRREMHSGKWTAFAISWQCGFAYVVALLIYQFGSAFSGNVHFAGLSGAIVVAAALCYMLLRKPKKHTEAI